MPDRPLTTTDVAALYGVTPETVANWADEGKLAHFKTPGGHRRFRRADLDPAVLAAAHQDGHLEPTAEQLS